MSDDPGHDVDYFTFEIARIIEIADDMATKRGILKLTPFIDAVRFAAPQLRVFRNAITHPIDRPMSIEVDYIGAALVPATNGAMDVLLDPLDYDLRLALHDLVSAMGEELDAA